MVAIETAGPAPDHLIPDSETEQAGEGQTAEMLPVHGGGVLAPELAGCDCAPVAGDATTRAALDAAGGATAKFTDNGGPVLQVIQVQLVYWGTAWAAASPPPTPTAAAVTAAVGAMVRGPMLTGLDEYRGIGRGFLRGATPITTSNPPAGFTDTQVWNFLNGEIAAGTLPAPDVDNQTLYMVVMPQGINPAGGNFIGEHTYGTRAGGQRVPFAWITNNGNLASLTRIISHEIVEACTDPEGSAFLGVAGTCNQGGWCEIGDICSSTAVRDGVTVQTFWSDTAGACVAPDWPGYAYPYSGVQFTGTLAANETRRWFTFNWREWQRVEWWMLPTTITPGGAQVRWDVALERASGNRITYWLTVTNLTAAPLTFEGRYTVLGRSA